MSIFKFRFGKKPRGETGTEDTGKVPEHEPLPIQSQKDEKPANSWWLFGKKPKKEMPGPDAGAASGREPTPLEPVPPMPPKPIPPKPAPPVPPKPKAPEKPAKRWWSFGKKQKTGPPRKEPPELSPESGLKKPGPDISEVLIGRRSPRSRLLPKLILLLLLVFLAALLFTLGPKYKLELMDKIAKIDKLGIMEKFGFKKPEPEKLITPEEEAIEELVTVRTYRVARGDFIDILPGMGTIKGEREIELRFPINGIVDSINFFEGDLVKKGDIIATLDQKDALLKLEYSKSKLKTQEVSEMSAKKKLEIHQQLYDKNIIIRPKLEEVRLEYEGSKTQVASAQKEVEFALAELDKTYLYSPVDGVMGTRDVEVGEFVNSNIKIASIYNASTVIGELGVIEKDIVRVALGQKARINVDTYPGVDFEGKIDNVAPIIEGKARTLTVKIRIENDNPKGTLLPGMFARFWVSVYEKKNTIKVPSACLYDLDNDGEFDSVYVVGDDNIATARAAKIGYISTDYIEITDGLNEGEQVVSEAMAELKDGVKVEVIEVQEAMF